MLCGGLADDHRHVAPYEALEYCLFNFGHASLGGKLLELKSIVAGHHAIRRPGKINHAGLCGDVGRMIGFTERSAGLVRRQVEIEITIVRGQHEGRIAIHLEILRSIGVP